MANLSEEVLKDIIQTKILVDIHFEAIQLLTEKLYEKLKAEMPEVTQLEVMQFLDQFKMEGESCENRH